MPIANQSPARYCRRLLPLAAVLILNACSFGRANQAGLHADTASLTAQVSANCSADAAALDLNRRNTLFAHPGLMSVNLHWDKGMTVNSAELLQRHGWAGRTLEIRDRDGDEIYQRALADPGDQFVGLHYSMGGHPNVLRESLQAVQKAGARRNQPLRYHAILVDPFAISEIGHYVDIDQPELGYLFILLSSDFSFLRPSVADIPQAFIDSGKVYFVYSEDFDENWGHFDMLSTLLESGKNTDHSSRKLSQLFDTMMRLSLGSHAPLTRQTDLYCEK